MRSALYLLYRRLARACMIALPDCPVEARELAEGYGALAASRNANNGATDILAEYAALLKYENAIYLAAHNGNVRSVDPTRIHTSPFWRPGVPLGAAAEVSHDQSDELRSRNSPFRSRSLQVLDLHRYRHVLNRHHCFPMTPKRGC